MEGRRRRRSESNRRRSRLVAGARIGRSYIRTASGTASYLDSLEDPRISVVHSAKNIGVNAYARAFRATRGRYLIELDDDVVDAPQRWDETLLRAFKRLPHVGYLAANLADDPHDVQ